MGAAKSVVAAGLAKRCIVQVSYAIGVPEPLSVFVDTYETGSKPDAKILALVNKKFDFRAGMIGEHLDLKRGVVGGKRGRYLKTAAYGHFGRDDQDVFTWEKVQARRQNSRPGEQEVRLPRGYDWRASGPQEGGGRGEAGALPEDRGVRALRARRPGRLHVGEGHPPPWLERWTAGSGI